MRRFLLLKVLLFLMVCATQLHAQTRIITGTVTSEEDGSTLPGVNIVVKNSTAGTVTDAKGTYSLSVGTNDVLIVSLIGFVGKEVLVGTQTIVDFSLSTDVKQLGEVVVIGYGTAARRDLTGNIASISGKDIQGVPVTSIEQSMQGKAAGVFVESENGKLGQGMKIRVRGSSSVSASNQPLYVVDGIPITSESQSSNGAETNPIADISFSDVASVEILKDADAAAIYGSRGANGVVLITTRRGKAWRTTFTVGYYGGTTSPTGKRKFMNSQQFVDYETQGAANAAALDNTYDYVGVNQSRLTRYAAGDANYATNGVNTNWGDQVLRTAAIGQLDVTASGGNEKTRFYASGQYYDANGILIGNHFKRMSARLNIDHTASDKFTFGLNFYLGRTENHRLSNDDAFSTPLQIVALSPITPIIDPRTNLLSGLLDPTTGAPNEVFPVYYNPLISIGNASYIATVFHSLANVYGQYNILPGLSFRSEAGIDLLLQTENQYLGAATVRDTQTPNGQGFNATTTIANYTTNNFFNYGKTIGVHGLDLTAGMSYQNSSNSGSSISAKQFPSDLLKAISSAAQITAASAGETNFSFLSYFARAKYKLKDRYLLSLSGRVDGSSRFGANHRYGFFPAGAVGWIISEEEFMKGFSFLSLLKFRASYGLTGNAGISNFAARGLYGPANYVGSGGQSPIQLENPNLKWETTAQTDIGIDFGFLGGRLAFEVDYYSKNTSNLLLQKNVPGTSGYTTFTQNIGNLQNKGFEFVITTTNIQGPLTWTTSLNFAANRNKITNLAGQLLGTNDLNRAIEGEPIGVFYGREFAGADVNNGDAIYYLNDGTPAINGQRATTNDYNAAQQVVLGNPNPKWFGGITNTVTYKGIDFSVLFQTVQGNMVYNGGGQYMSSSASNGFDNQTLDQLNSWKKPGDVTMVPQARMFFANGTNASSRYLSSGSYVRLKSITLGYTLPEAIVSKSHLSKVRIYVSAQNLLTFTKYKGWDPEVNADFQSSNINQGVDFYSAPQPKNITGGVNITF